MLCGRVTITETANQLRGVDKRILERMLTDVDEHSLTGRAIELALSHKGSHPAIPEDREKARARL